MKREKGERIGDPFYRFFIGKREGTLWEHRTEHIVVREDYREHKVVGQSE